MKTLMIASEAQQILAILLTHVKMVVNVLIKLTTLSANAYLDSLARNVRYMSLSYILNFCIKYCKNIKIFQISSILHWFSTL